MSSSSFLFSGMMVFIVLSFPQNRLLPRLISKFESIEIFSFFVSVGIKSHNFGSRQDTDSVPCQTEFTPSAVKRIFIMKVVWTLEVKSCFIISSTTF